MAIGDGGRTSVCDRLRRAAARSSRAGAVGAVVATVALVAIGLAGSITWRDSSRVARDADDAAPDVLGFRLTADAPWRSKTVLRNQKNRLLASTNVLSPEFVAPSAAEIEAPPPSSSPLAHWTSSSGTASGNHGADSFSSSLTSSSSSSSVRPPVPLRVGGFIQHVPHELHETLAQQKHQGAAERSDAHHKRTAAVRLPEASPRVAPVATRIPAWLGVSESQFKASPPTLPLPAGPRVPKRMFTTNPSKQLSPALTSVADEWEVIEHWDSVVLDEADCAYIASLFPAAGPHGVPGLARRYARIRGGVQVGKRFVLCRAMAVYLFGGIARSPEVRWRRSLKVWAPLDSDSFVGRQNAIHVAPWFFGAKPGDVCFLRVIKLMLDLYSDNDIEGGGLGTGASALSAVFNDCGAGPRFKAIEMIQRNIRYPFELREHESSRLRSYAVTLAHRLLAPASTKHSELPIRIARVTVSSSELRRPYYAFGPRNLFDGNLETWMQTGLQKLPYVDVVFGEPVLLGHPDDTMHGDGEDGASLSSSAAAGEPAAGQQLLSKITGVRVFSRRRDVSADELRHPVHLCLYDANGTVVYHDYTASATDLGFYTFIIDGERRSATRMRLYKRGRNRQLSIAEIQFFTDSARVVATRAVVEAYSDNSGSTNMVDGAQKPAEMPAIFSRVAAALSSCADSRAVSPDTNFYYSICGDAAVRRDANCAIYAMADSRAVLNAGFLAEMWEGGCPVTVVAPELPAITNKQRSAGIAQFLNVTWCPAGTAAGVAPPDETSSGGTPTPRGWSMLSPSPAPLETLPPCDAVRSYDDLMTFQQRPTVVYLEQYPEDWADPRHPLLNLMVQRPPPLLLVPLRLENEIVHDDVVLRGLELLLERFELVGVHANVAAGFVSSSGSLPAATAAGENWPAELQLSLRPKPPAAPPSS